MSGTMELLAPGGSPEGLKAAVNAGADAIYMGGMRFGARAYADNPDPEKLLECMDYCHLHGSRLYLTVNTLLRERELLGQLYADLAPLVERGLDAVLVQDLGVFAFIQREFPDLPIHVSTQMSAASACDVRVLKEMGAARIVLARELSLQEIRKIHEEVDIELEAFVHGALCYCYSGQCLMSSMIGGRSGNRGRCAQPCRLPYEVSTRPGQKIHALSLKDICTLSLLPELKKAGIISLKIEGRMKRPEYAAGVTEIYRKYLDRLEDVQHRDEAFVVDPEDERALMDLFNRGGFSKGYYLPAKKGSMMAFDRPDHCGTQAAKVVKAQKNRLQLQALEKLYRGDSLILPAASSGGTALGKGQENKRSSEIILEEDAAAGQRFAVRVPGRLPQEGSVLMRVRSEHQLERLRSLYIQTEAQEKIKGLFRIAKGSPAILQVWLSGASSEKLSDKLSVTVTGIMAQEAKNTSITREDVRRSLGKTGGSGFVFEELEIELEDQLFFPQGEINRIRRSALEALKEKILGQYRRTLPEGGRISPEDGKISLEGDRISPEGGRISPDGGRISMEKLQGRREDGSNGAQISTAASNLSQARALGELNDLTRIELDSLMFMDFPEYSFRETAALLHKRNKQCFLIMPPVWRSQAREAFFRCFTREDLALVDGFVLRSIGQFADLDRLGDGSARIVTETGLYTWNTLALSRMHQLGADECTLPLELNEAQLLDLCSRRPEKPEISLVLYGRSPLMISAQCLQANTAGCLKHASHEYLSLKDRTGARFPVFRHCSICTNVIYNSQSTDLSPFAQKLTKAGIRNLRLCFTDETPEEAALITRRALAGEYDTASALTGNFTRGHFKRGVE